MRSLASIERAALCDLLGALGPDGPTLCAGWRTRDLAAHLVLREGRPDALPGIVLPVAAPWTHRLQARLAAGDFGALVARLRAGPPRLSPFRPPAVDEAANGIEFFVHHEDVRRAQPGWEPRNLDRATDDYLWRRARAVARAALRGANGRTALVRSGTAEAYLPRRPKAGRPVTIVCGSPSELLLYVFGRRAHAQVRASLAWMNPVAPARGPAAR